MSRNVVDKATVTQERRKSRRNTLLWIGLATLAVIVLMALEQVALLYVLATLGVAALMAVVAFADLRGAKQAAPQLAPGDDAASVGDRTAKASAFGPAASRGRR